MDKPEAVALLRSRLNPWRTRSYKELADQIGETDRFELSGASGMKYQVTIQVFWDGEPTAMDHVQAVTVVDPGAGRAARRFDVIVTERTDVVNRTEPLPPGTRLGNLTPADQCTAPDGKFVQFSGTVE